MPAGGGLVAAPAGGPAQREGEAGAGDQPGERLGGQGCPPRAGTGASLRGITRSASFTSSSSFSVAVAGISGEPDVAAQGVADGGLAELGGCCRPG
jgi:hypothetical protein